MLALFTLPGVFAVVEAQLMSQMGIATIAVPIDIGKPSAHTHLLFCARNHALYGRSTFLIRQIRSCIRSARQRRRLISRNGRKMILRHKAGKNTDSPRGLNLLDRFVTSHPVCDLLVDTSVETTSTAGQPLDSCDGVCRTNG